MKNKYICIHGHFYQPPRENAWLETVELQDSALPFHDWNERINFECYAPNSAARILNEQQNIIKITNNYSKINFNFGPTLLSWMEQADPDAYRAILEADQKSQTRYNGHGSAIAQAHSHLILPLCNARDKETQVIWGIKDFEHRFGRKPEGMWLAETATNTDSLEVLAAQGIKYTILAPRQAKAYRKIGEKNWHQLPHDSVDPRRPYLCNLPSGKSIYLFFYDGNVAQDVAFNGLLNNGKAFANRLIQAFDKNDEPQIVHIATDGESYGHHHRYGEMALADCLNNIGEKGIAQLTNYGEYLDLFPPTYEIQIHENSSWSCVHGVERWKSNCGCNTGGRPHWNQEWRSHLRNLLDWLRDELIPIYEREAGKLLKDVWAARNDFIEVLLNRNDESVDAFIKQHAKKALGKNQKIQLLRLMEMQRHAMFMYTSCGWFFDEISGIETNQILQYALRAINYAEQVGGINLHPAFLKKLEKAPSNVYKNGAVSYKDHVIPAKVDLVRVGMHYAVLSLFEKQPQRLEFLNYIATTEFFERIEAGNMKLAIGRTTVKSKITYSEKHFSFGVLYLGQQNIIGNISIDMKKSTFDEMHQKITTAFHSTNLGDAIGTMKDYFDGNRFTIWHLFRDQKRKILRQISKESLNRSEAAFREIYKDNYQLMTGMAQSNIPIPSAYRSAAEYIINTDLHRFFLQSNLNIDDLKRFTGELKKWDINLNNQQSFKLAASERLFFEIKKTAIEGVEISHLKMLNEIFDLLKQIQVELDIWKSQNFFFSITKGYKKGDWVFSNEEWKNEFIRLGKHLKIVM